MIAHSVYFSLNDNGEQAKQQFLADCHTYLASAPGAVFYAAGTLSDVARPVSDRDYDVALHLVFQTRADLDAYGANPQHLEFIARNKPNWKKLRVFDSDVSTGG